MIDNYFRNLCTSPLWNSSLIYSNNPDFPICFQYTLLQWIPCFIMWILAPFWFYMLTRERPFKFDYTWLFICRMILTSLLIVIEILFVIFKTDYQNYLTSFILLSSYIFVIVIVYFEHKKGLRSSMLLFSFWSLQIVVSLILIRSHILHYYELNYFRDRFQFIISLVYCSLIASNLFLSCFSEKSKLPTLKSSDSNMKLYPENYVSLLSKLSFWWINSLISTGYKRDLVKEDCWQIEESERTEELTKELEDCWTRESKSYLADLSNFDSKSSESPKKPSIIYKTKSHPKEELSLNPDDVKISKQVKKRAEPSLALCFIKVFGRKFIAGSLLKLIQDCLIFVGPTVLNWLIKFIKDKNQANLMGYFYTVLLLVTHTLQTLFLQHYFHRMFIVGARVRTAVMGLIYKKSLRLSSTSKKDSTVGQMMNLMSVDSQTLIGLTIYLNMIWSAPLQISVSMYMLWQYIGVSALAGLATMIIFVPFNALVTHISKKLRRSKMKVTDSRIKTTNEILNGIKVIKLYGWEISFRNIVQKIRDKEIGLLKKLAFTNATASFSWSCAPLLVSIVSFATFVLIDPKNELDASTAFVCLTLFNILRFPLSILPMVITSIVETKVALERIKSFLLKEEINENDITHRENGDKAITIENLSVGWNNKEAILNNLNLNVKKGELVAVVGSVGSGKTSFLSCLLGDMHKFDGAINIDGSLAYVPQQPWIQNATLKANILFGYPLDETFYRDVIRACALRSDLKILTAGDETEIGEKGINLSGGQKARVSLSRAVYSNADIYILDDPLSAVDAHVSKHIFDSVVGPQGMLKNKTRILVTNSLNYLPQMDKIVMLNDGRISEMGTYDELKRKENGQFASFVKLYLDQHDHANETSIETQDEVILDKEKSPKAKETEANGALALAKSTKSMNKEALVGKNLIEKEKTKSGSINLSVIIEYLKSCKIHWTIIFLVFSIMSNAAQLGSSLWLSDWSNKFAIETNSSDKTWRLLVYVILGLSQCFLTLFTDFIFIVMFIGSAKSLHNSMLHSILRSTMSFFESTPVGRIINRFSKDVEAVEGSIPESYKSVIRCLFQVLSTITVISISTPLFLISLVPMAVIYIFYQRYYVASTRQLKRLESVSKSPIFSHFGETLTGISTIRAYNSQKRFIKVMNHNIDENLIFYYASNVSNRWLAIRLEFIGTLINFFACLFAVLARDRVSAGMAGLSISVSLNISQVLNWLVRMCSEFEANITSIERIKEYCNTPHEAPWETQTIELPKDWPNAGHVEFKNYSVKYRPDLDFVLRDLNLNIQPGEKIGVVGRTGAGKSSLTLGLFRILEHNVGEIVIDDIDIKKIGLHDLRKRLTIIPQDPVLFSGTLKMNLDPFDQYAEDKLWEILERTHLKTYVSGLDKQLLYECSEGGENLSVGQRQLICLARALLRKSKVLVLDEATAAIDHNTDDLIQTTIRESFSDCTVLTIAHRLNTIMDSSRIMVLSEGRIVEFDSPSNLLQNTKSIFYSMAKDADLISN